GRAVVRGVRRGNAHTLAERACAPRRAARLARRAGGHATRAACRRRRGAPCGGKAARELPRGVRPAPAPPVLMALLCPACAAPLPARASIRGIDRLHGTPGSFRVLTCAVCGSGRTIPIVPADQLASFYPAEYGAHRRTVGRARSPSRLVDRLRSRPSLRRPPLRTLHNRSPGHLLDVGSGRGDLGVLLRDKGWQVTGIEPSGAACDEARSRGVSTEQGTLETVAPRLPGGFRAVVFRHSLEHVVEPADDLLLARALLADGGL